jgi:hypothetical protein
VGQSCIENKNCLVILIDRTILMPVQVAARSNAWVSGRSLAEIAGSNPTGGMDICLMIVVCVCACVRACDGYSPTQDLHFLDYFSHQFETDRSF